MRENGYMCVCVWLSPFDVHLKLSQHCLLIGYTAIPQYRGPEGGVGGNVLKRAEGFFVEKQASQSENKSCIEGYSVCEACDRNWRGMLKATHQRT